MSDDIRWDGYTHEEIYKMVNTGPGHLASSEAQAVWPEVEERLRAINEALRTATARLTGGWEGTAAEAAHRGLIPLGDWAETTVRNARRIAGTLDTQAEHVATMRNSVPPPSGPLPEEPPLFDRIFGSFYEGDWYEADAKRDELARQAVHAMDTYTANSARNKHHIYGMGVPPAVTSDSVVAVTPAALAAADLQASPGGAAGVTGAGSGGGSPSGPPGGQAVPGPTGPGGQGGQAPAPSTPGAVALPPGAPPGAPPSAGGSDGRGRPGGPGGPTPAPPITPAPPTTPTPPTTTSPGTDARTNPPPSPQAGRPSPPIQQQPGPGSPNREQALPNWRTDPSIVNNPGGRSRVPSDPIGTKNPPHTIPPRTPFNPQETKNPPHANPYRPTPFDPRGTKGVTERSPYRVAVPDAEPPGARAPGARGETLRPGTETGGPWRNGSGTVPADGARPGGTRSAAGHPGMLPMMGAGAGAGAGDREHRRPSYLVDDSDAFVDDRWFTPAVITPDDPPPGPSRPGTHRS